MKVAFLDVDGVLILNHSPTDKFNNEAVYNLKELEKQTGCKWVVSSSRRIGITLLSLQNFFIKNGLDIQLLGVTSYTGNRAEEISLWLNNNPEYDSYVVIDDNYFDIVPQHSRNLVKVSPDEGFSSYDLHKAVKILNA